MSHTQVQWARGSSSQVGSYVGPIGELVLNTDDWSLQSQDGVTAGGWVIRPRLNVRTVTGTGAQTVNVTDDLIAWLPGTPAATTFALPASPRFGEVHEFQYLAASGSFAMTVAAASGQTINGVASIAISTINGTISVLYIGSNQWIARCPAASEIPGFAPSATTDTTNASNISSGTLAAARGGAGTTTGALKANGSGVVSQAAASDLSDTVAPTAWTPTDQSGAGLTLTNNASYYYKLGKLVVATVDVTYPASPGSAANAKLSLPAATNSGVLNAAVNGTILNVSGSSPLYYVAQSGAAIVEILSNLLGGAASNNSLASTRLAFIIVFFTA